MRPTTAADPARVAEYTFRHDHWDTAKEIIRAAMQPHARLVVKSCHASSKTFALADVILLSLLYGGDVITTAPTGDQVKGQLWEYVHRAIREGCIPPQEWGEVNQLEITLPTGERAFGRSTNQGVRFQGYHAREGAFLLLVVDEAPGVLAEIFGAISGMAAGGDVRIAIAGNPLVPEGEFYDLFDNPSWRRITIDAFETPNLGGLTLERLLAMRDTDELDIAERPYMVTRRWVLDKYDEVKGDLTSPEWMGRVRGQFPDLVSTSLIAGSWLELAKTKLVNHARTGSLTAGLDVAGPGEAETVLTVVRGADILEMEGWPQADPGDEVKVRLDHWLHRNLKEINVDAIGIGWGMYVDLKKRYEPHGVTVRDVNVALPSEVEDERGNPKFANLKAEYYWHLRELFADGDVAGLTNERAIKQLRRIRYKHDAKNRIAIESKEDAQKRGDESPDYAESLMLAFAPDDPNAAYAQAFFLRSSMR